MDIDRMMDNTRRLIESRLMKVNNEVWHQTRYVWDITDTGIRNLVDNATLNCAGAITDQLMYEVYGID